MEKFFSFFGGRKVFMILVSIVIVACSKVIGLDEETQNKLIVLSLGGSGVVALEDSVQALVGKKKTTAKKK